MDRMSIRVWPFQEAPKKYQALSNNGGDEDWVAFVPARYKDRYIPWLASCSFDARGEPQECDVSDGTVYIGSHA